ncbi:MAG: helix-turn-helix transcriptional regulator [Rhodospirillales bacterium]|nr:helix-turn-helix transcriptional regulator [Rhodospirillales bacterium]
MTKSGKIRSVDLGVRSVDLGEGAASSFQIRQLLSFNYSPAQGEAPEHPHRHNFQELIWIKSGTGKQAIDGETMEIRPSTFYLIAKGQVHQFLEAKDINGFVLRFTEEFRPQFGLSSTQHFSEAYFNNVRAIPALSVDGHQVSDFELLFNLIMKEYKAPEGFGKNAILRHLLQVLLVKIAQYINDDSTKNDPATPVRDDIFKDFLSLLEEYYLTHHDVAFYANALAITPRQLSDRTKRIIGKTAKNAIEERLVLEAKRSLKFTDRSVKEIAYKLGYEDPSYFSKVFKRVTGYTPQDFQTS